MYDMDIRMYGCTYTYQKVIIKYLKGTNFRGGNFRDFVPTSVRLNFAKITDTGSIVNIFSTKFSSSFTIFTYVAVTIVQLYNKD